MAICNLVQLNEIVPLLRSSFSLAFSTIISARESLLASTYNPTEKGLASGLCSFRVPKKLGGTVTTEVSFQLIILV